MTSDLESQTHHLGNVRNGFPESLYPYLVYLIEIQTLGCNVVRIKCYGVNDHSALHVHKLLSLSSASLSPSSSSFSPLSS